MGSVKRKKTKTPGVYEVELPRLYHKEPDKAFYIVYFFEGKHHWEKVGTLSEGYDEKMAEIVRQERLRSIRHEEELPQKKNPVVTFKKLAEQYLEWAEENKARAGKEDRSNYRNHLAPLFDRKRLNAITSFDLERMKSNLLKDGLSPATVKHNLILVRQMFNKAKAWGVYTGENPVAGVKLPTLQNERTRFLSREESEQLLAALEKTSTILHDMALLSLHCGLRAKEIFSLRGHDLDTSSGLINVSDPKNKHPRKAFMTETVKEMFLKRLPKNVEDLIFKARPTDKNPNGGEIPGVSQAFRKTVERLNFNKGVSDRRQRVCFHTLRHTYASWLAIQKTPILTISELIGHRDLKMTRRYAHLTPDHKKEAVADLEKFINEDRKKVKLEIVATIKKEA